MITRDFSSSFNAEIRKSMLIRASTHSLILHFHGHRTTKLVDSFHGVLV
jgi:hypothetical protein